MAIYDLSSDAGEPREIEFEVDRDEEWFFVIKFNDGDGDEIAHVVIDSREKLNEAEAAFRKAFDEAREKMQ